MSTFDLSIIIPAYNEATRLGGSLELILAYLEGRGSFEVLVADDGSTDETAELAARFADEGVRVTRSEQNLGKGAAVKRGALESRGDWVLITDADLSTPIEDLEKLEARAHEAPLVFGSRAVASSRVVVRQPFHRELMGKTFNRLVRLAGVRGIHDTQCGFKLLRGLVARELFADLVTPGFAYDVELAWLAHRRGHKVVEVGVDWYNSPDSRVSPIADSLSMLREIARFRRHHRAARS